MDQNHRIDEVVLFGTWASSPCTRVKLALELKGIPYKYVEEDLRNKSQLLLTFNTVHKQVPVLVHNAKPIAESLVILEYIDEVWNVPTLLPADPYLLARARFWAKFYDQKVIPSTFKTKFTDADNLEAAVKEFNDLLTVFEEGIQKDFPNLFQSNAEKEDIACYLEIVVGSHACNYAAFEEAVAVIIDKAKHPAFISWINSMKAKPLMKEILPPHHKLVTRIKTQLGPKS